MKFKLNYSDYGSEDHTQHGDDDYDYSWSRDHDYSYHGAYIVPDGKYFDVALFPDEHEPKLNDVIYVVYVSYGTGDSFGCETGKRVHLWAFTSIYVANCLVDLLNADGRKEDSSEQPLYFNGVPISTADWKGYFESFGGAGIEEITIQKNRGH